MTERATELKLWREVTVGASHKGLNRMFVAPELKGRKPILVIRPFPRMLRQCIGLDRVRRWCEINASRNLSGTAGKFRLVSKNNLWDDFLCSQRNKRG